MTESPASAAAPLGPEDRAWLIRIAALVSNSPLLIFERDGRKNFTRLSERRRALLVGIITDAAQDSQKETNDVE